MRSFFSLVWFEYKKIFKRKSAVIALVLVTAAVAFSPLAIFFGTAYIDGESYESHYQAMVKDRTYAMALSGREIDETLIEETKDAYSKIPAAERYGVTPEYQEYARPYSEIFRIMSMSNNLNLEELGTFNRDDMLTFYKVRHEQIAADIQAGAISNTAKDTLIKLDTEIKTPFIFAYIGGFDSLIGGIYTIGVVCAFALAICLAPVFAGEYSTGADQLILSSKLGKSKVISAKLFTSIFLSVKFFVILVLFSVITCMFVYGYDGASAPIQLIMPFLVYPLSILESVIIFTVCTFFGTLLIAALTLLLSSKFKSPFGVIIIISVLIFVPMMLSVPETTVWLYNLFSLLPTSMMSVWAVFSHVPYDFFGLIVMPYIFLPIFAILASIAMLPLTRKSFRHHQIG